MQLLLHTEAFPSTFLIQLSSPKLRWVAPLFSYPPKRYLLSCPAAPLRRRVFLVKSESCLEHRQPSQPGPGLLQSSPWTLVGRRTNPVLLFSSCVETYRGFNRGRTCSCSSSTGSGRAWVGQWVRGGRKDQQGQQQPQITHASGTNRRGCKKLTNVM
jgi:hypothetical protein